MADIPTTCALRFLISPKKKKVKIEVNKMKIMKTRILNTLFLDYSSFSVIL